MKSIDSGKRRQSSSSIKKKKTFNHAVFLGQSSPSAEERRQNSKNSAQPMHQFVSMQDNCIDNAQMF